MPDINYPFVMEEMMGVNRAMTESEVDLLLSTTFCKLTGGETSLLHLFSAKRLTQAYPGNNLFHVRKL